MRDKKMKAKTGGEGRDDTCDHGLSRSWEVNVCKKKKKKKVHGMRLLLSHNATCILSK